MTYSPIARPIEIEKYLFDDGTAPFDRWFSRLPEDVQARIDTRIDRLSLGNFGDSVSLGGGLYELRLFFGPGYRIYFGVRADDAVVLLLGGDKRTQRRDISTAKAVWVKVKREKSERKEKKEKKETREKRELRAKE